MPGTRMDTGFFPVFVQIHGRGFFLCFVLNSDYAYYDGYALRIPAFFGFVFFPYARANFFFLFFYMQVCDDTWHNIA